MPTVCIRLVWEVDNRRIVSRATKLIFILCFYHCRPKNTQISRSDILKKEKTLNETKNHINFMRC
jgi:hypothetical protein